MSVRIRKPYCAGTWYNNNPKLLADEIDEYLNKVKNEKLNIKAVIVPHAGYAYSGQTAAHSFKQLSPDTKTVFVLGTAHRFPLRGANITNFDYYSSPLGSVKISEDINNILKENNVVSIEEADYGEHSIEIEIPFLQRTLKNFSIIPIIVGKVDPVDFSFLMEKYLDEKTVIVASVDLSHFHSYDEAKELDDYSIKCILDLNSEGIKQAEIDSPYAIMALIEIARRKNWKVKLLDYKNSGDIVKDKESVVGYSSIVFYEAEEKLFTGEEKKYMEKLAKDTVETFVKEGRKITLENPSQNLMRWLACFVTIKDKIDLRGCIGTIEPTGKLYESIIDNAISAATRDYRFEPITEAELPDLNYEVSVLTEPKELSYKSENDLLEKIIDKGVILEKYGHRAVYLPQVWEHFGSAEDFLSSLCRKAGLRNEDWKDKGMRFYIFDLC
jgi:MEMO1 family protein